MHASEQGIEVILGCRHGVERAGELEEDQSLRGLDDRGAHAEVGLLHFLPAPSFRPLPRYVPDTARVETFSPAITRFSIFAGGPGIGHPAR